MKDTRNNYKYTEFQTTVLEKENLSFFQKMGDDITSPYYCILIVLIICQQSFCQNGNYFRKVFKDKKLEEQSLFILTGLTEVQCLFECTSQVESGSLNYHKESKTCMVNRIVDEASTEETNLKTDNGWMFYQKEINVRIFLKLKVQLLQKYVMESKVL